MIDGSVVAYRGGGVGLSFSDPRFWPCASGEEGAGVPGLRAKTGGNFGEVVVWGGALCGVELGTPWTNLALTFSFLEYFK